MADPVPFTAGVLALATAAGTAFKISRSLYAPPKESKELRATAEISQWKSQPTAPP
jgi:hypothetical protein